MKYKFEINGTIKLIIEPQTTMEREIFKELFSGDMDVTLPVNANSAGEVVIQKKEGAKLPLINNS